MEESRIVEGRNAVLEAFRSGKTIDKLFVLEGCKDGPVQTILREAKKSKDTTHIKAMVSLLFCFFSIVIHYIAPLFSIIPAFVASSIISPSLDTPSPYIMSTVAVLNGGATLFLTTLIEVLLPTTDSPTFICSLLLTSNLIVE